MIVLSRDWLLSETPVSRAQAAWVRRYRGWLQFRTNGLAMVGLVTVLALAYAGLLEGAVITETVFSWPGLGLYLTVSLLNADMNAVLGATLVVGLVYLVLNLLADVLYRLLDPRVA